MLGKMHEHLEMFSKEAGSYITQKIERWRQPREETSSGDTPMGDQFQDTETYGPNVQNSQHTGMDPDEPYPAVWDLRRGVTKARRDHPSRVQCVSQPVVDRGGRF